MVDLAIFELIVLLIAIPLSYLGTRLAKIISYYQYEEELNKMFNWFWNGTPEGEVYAWYKVRMLLKLREGEKKKIDYVNRKIAELNKYPLYGTLSVSESGELISGNTATIDC